MPVHTDTPAAPAKDERATAEAVDSRTLAAIRCARRFIIGDPAYEIGQTDARLILDRLSRETARADAAVTEAKALREALEKIGERGSGYTTGEGHQRCKEIAWSALEARATLAQPADGGEVMNALAALIERVEGPFEGPVREWSVAFHAALPEATVEMWRQFVKALQGDLNLAVAFTEALLPGWGWEINGDRQGGFKAAVEGPNAGDGYADSGEYRIPEPALALVLAALKAKLASVDALQEKEKG